MWASKNTKRRNLMNTWCSSASSTSDVNEEIASADLTSVATHTSSDTRLGKLSMSFSGHCIFTLYLFILFIPINVMELHLFSWHFSKRYCFAPLYMFDSYFNVTHLIILELIYMTSVLVINIDGHTKLLDALTFLLLI